MAYKSCAVPACTNTTIRTPQKLFVCVPKNEKIRKKWLQLARRNPTDIMDSTVLFFCEDHFDIKKDMANYLQYKMGFSERIIMVNGVLPTKFHCQLDRSKRSIPNTLRPAFVKRQRNELIKECEATLQNTLPVLKVFSESSSSKFNCQLDCGKRRNANTSRPRTFKESKPLQRTETVLEVSSNRSLSYNQHTATAAVGIIMTADDHSCYSEDSLPEGVKDVAPAPDLHCSVCTKAITGSVFVCVQCGVRECGACDARGRHAAHYVLRAPSGSAEEQLKEVVVRIREAISTAGVELNPGPLEPEKDKEQADDRDENRCNYENLEFKTEIKLEVDVEDEDPLGSFEYEDPYPTSAPEARASQVVPEQNEVKLEKPDSPAGPTAAHRQTGSTSPSSPLSLPSDSDDSQPLAKRRHVSDDHASHTVAFPTHTPRTKSMKPDRKISTSDPNADPGFSTVAASLNRLKRK